MNCCYMYFLYYRKAVAQYEAELARKVQADNEIQAPIPETEGTTVDNTIPPQQPAESDTVDKEDKDQGTNTEITAAVPVASSATNALIEPSTSDPR